MITKINKLQDFGIFKAFNWGTTLNPFQKNNLLYGWNYSGKTTLSKLFMNLEAKNKIYFPDAEYSISSKVGEQPEISFTNNQLSGVPFSLKVFNSCYIREIFAWDNTEINDIEPIKFYLGKEASEIQPKIKELKEIKLKKLETSLQEQTVLLNEFNDYAKENGKFAKKATEIREKLNNRVKQSDFNKKHFVEILNLIKSDPNHYLIAEENIDKIRSQAISEKIYEELTPIRQPNEILNSLTKKVKSILEETAPKNIPFPELDEDKKLFEWVQEGLELHTDSKVCKFCENTISLTRIDNLNQYYSNKLQEIQNTIRTAKYEIEAERKKFNILFVHESKLAAHLRNEYTDQIDTFKQLLEEYYTNLARLESDLTAKESSMFMRVSASEITVLSFKSIMDKINYILNKHNKFVEEFEENKNLALESILSHYVGQYIIEESYSEKESKNLDTQTKKSKIEDEKADTQQEIERLEARLKNTVQGKEEINKYLEIFLNRKDIKIDIVEGKFQLKRNDFPASDLSEGEKTAISFAYFLTELKSLQAENKLKNTIVLIDDPISSLDSNHIFQVRSLINLFFKIKDDYCQLFILTHNFEFFSMMLDSNLFKNKNKKYDKPERGPFYFILRQSEEQSIIDNLPVPLRAYKSEYAQLFHILKGYADSEVKESFEYKLLLPNTLRRFLELYTLIRYPKGYSEIDDRLTAIFSDSDKVYHLTKLYHWFSHENQFERATQFDSKIFNIDEAIKEVLKFIEENDKLHWKGLTEI